MRRKAKLISEINVTPFVDVMLVLLVVFMVTAPLLTVGVQVDLPRADAAPLAEAVEPIVVSVNAEGQIFIQERQVGAEELEERLRAIGEGGYDQRIYVRGDGNVGYGRVIEVMGAMNRAGFSRLALIARPVGEEK